MSLWRVQSGANAMTTAEQKMKNTSSHLNCSCGSRLDLGSLTAHLKKLKKEKRNKNGWAVFEFFARQLFKLATVKRWPTHDAHTAASAAALRVLGQCWMRP
jgi:hypothetical protein